MQVGIVGLHYVDQAVDAFAHYLNAIGGCGEVGLGGCQFGLELGDLFLKIGGLRLVTRAATDGTDGTEEEESFHDSSVVWRIWTVNKSSLGWTADVLPPW